MDDRSEAISFANGYFALADGLASGLEDHLAEHVVLHWFGRTVKGRKNVTGFMNAHKANSRHVFANIAPSVSVGYRKARRNRRRSSRVARVAALRTSNGQEAKVFVSLRNREGAGEGGGSSLPPAAGHQRANCINADARTRRELAEWDHLTEGDLGNLFKLEIGSTDIEEIEESIDRMKLEEGVAATRERGQGDGPDVARAGAIKYVEADGRIEFTRRLSRKDTYVGYPGPVANVYTWDRPCKLRIAYSAVARAHVQTRAGPHVRLENAASNIDGGPATRVAPQPRATPLLSFEEINKLSNRLVPNDDDFGGYLKDCNFFDDRDRFIENFELATAAGGLAESKPALLSPRYAQASLPFKSPRSPREDRQSAKRHRIIFNYRIHLIVYEGSNKCRANLLKQFEKQA